MPYVKGFLNIVEGGSPDNSLPGGSGGSVDNTLPGMGVGIDNTLPTPPPGVWPPPTISHPIVPVPPGSTVPPGTIWPSPGRPDNSLPGGGGGSVDNTLPPGVDNTLPGGSGGSAGQLPVSNKFWIVAGIPGYGWRYVCVDPSLTIGYPMPPAAVPEPK